jgi:CubicO group peptidase (beta-lactamase class C family)
MHYTLYKSMWQDAISEPAHTASPFELMYKSGPLNFAPGSSCKYSTTGFAVLGLALCAVQGCESYHQLDMLAWLPSDLRRKLNHTVFPTNGTPADVSPIHACEVVSGPPHADVFNIGGTFSGYTASFMASTASEAAQLLYAVNSVHSDCLSNESRRLMRLVERTDIRPYGFGTEIFAPSFLGMPEVFIAIGVLKGMRGELTATFPGRILSPRWTLRFLSSRVTSMSR